MMFSPSVRQGIKESIPLFIPAIPFALVFGIVVGESGVPTLIGWSSAPIIFGGAAQITLLTLIGEGASIAAATTAALIVGARHLLYSVTMAPQFQGQPTWFRWLGPYVLIDQVFALAVVHKELGPEEFRQRFLSVGLTFWTLWMTFTALGLFLGPIIPVEWNLAFAAPVLFVGLLTVSVDRWQKAVVAVVAMIITVALADLPHRSGLLVGAALGVVLGLVLERFRR